MVRSTPTSQNASGNALLALVLVLVGLYLARVVFIPLALALLLAFLLGPPVVKLRRLGIPRLPAVLMVVILSFSLIGSAGFFMVIQLGAVARQLPQYQENVRQKLETIRDSGGGVIRPLVRAISNLSRDLTPKEPLGEGTSGIEEQRPVPVEIRQAPFAPLDLAQKLAGPVLNWVLMGGIVVVFVVFMLLQREDLRDRFIRLLGEGRVNVTTQAIDDTAQRLSRFLGMQLLLNVAFAIPVGIGLFAIGVPNAGLWALLALILRYVPYLGIWIAASLPALLAFAVEPGWVEVLLIIALYLGTDLIMYNVLEPLLYGSSTGISPIAILTAAVFWTWLWGPVGLLLSTPLTVCLVVVGRYVPKLEYLSILLSDKPVLDFPTRFYQRMLAMDLQEATDLAESYLRKNSLESLYDEVVLPALTLAENDRHQGKLDVSRQQFIFQNTKFLVEDVLERAEHLMRSGSNREIKDLIPSVSESGSVGVPCIAARDEADDIAAHMLARLLRRQGILATPLSSTALASESLREVGAPGVEVVCVTAVPPFGYTHARYLCRRLRAQYPRLKIVAAILTEGDTEELRHREPPIPADEFCCSLRQASGTISALARSKAADLQSR